MVIHLVDGTYELFRHFYGRRSGGKRDDQPLGAAAGVLHTVLQMLETGTTHVGVATDHVIESFRNELWPGYKDGSGVDRALRLQFEPFEEVLAALGVVVWPMVELEPTTRSPRRRGSPATIQPGTSSTPMGQSKGVHSTTPRTDSDLPASSRSWQTRSRNP